MQRDQKDIKEVVFPDLKADVSIRMSEKSLGIAFIDEKDEKKELKGFIISSEFGDFRLIQDLHLHDNLHVYFRQVPVDQFVKFNYFK